MVWNPAAASCLMVPGKSSAIMARTGHVWQPMGRPRGFAPSSSVPAESAPATAAPVADFLKNSLLEIADIEFSLRVKSVRGIFNPPAELSHGLRALALLVFTNALQDILGAGLREVEEARIARNLPEHGRHQLRVSERFVVEVDLNLQQLMRQAQGIILGGVF